MKFTPTCAHRFPRSLVPLVCLLLAAGGGPWNLGAAPASPTGEPKRVAILGFVPAGERTGDAAEENLGVGVADLLEGELDRRGLAVCERRSIALALSERRLGADGLTRNDADVVNVVRQRLPSMRYLLRGDLGVSSGNVVTLSAGIVDTESGAEVAAVRREGPENALAGTVAALADDVAGRLAGLAGGNARPHRPVPGFTTVPEVALLHYRGLAELLADRPEYAVAFFTEATRADPAFTVARGWKARAYERLELTEFAAASLRPLGNAPAGPDPASVKDSGRRLAAVIAVTPGTETAASLAAFKERFPAVAGTSWAVLNPGLIDALAAESDLRLGGMFEGGNGLGALQGLGTDAAVGLETLAPTDGKPARLRATVVRAGTGELLGREEANGTTPADAAALAERVARMLSGDVGNASPGIGASSATAGPPRYPWPASARLTRDRFAQTLYRVVRCPKDRWAWIELNRIMHGFRDPEFLDPEVAPLTWAGSRPP